MPATLLNYDFSGDLSEYDVHEGATVTVSIVSNELKINKPRNHYGHIHHKTLKYPARLRVEAKLKSLDLNSGAAYAPAIAVYWDQDNWLSVRNDFTDVNLNITDVVAGVFTHTQPDGNTNGDTAFHWYRIEVDRKNLTVYKSDDGLAWTQKYQIANPKSGAAPKIVMFGGGWNDSVTHTEASEFNNDGAAGTVQDSFVDDIKVFVYPKPMVHVRRRGRR